MKLSSSVQVYYNVQSVFYKLRANYKGSKIVAADAHVGIVF